jgi:hypothetical protein
MLVSSITWAAEIYDTFPDNINANEKYVFYSHGYIVEGTNPRPKNPRWGIYKFAAIKESLSDSEYNLTAYHRQKGTDPFEHAEILADNVREFLRGGGKAKHITIMGFS